MALCIQNTILVVFFVTMAVMGNCSGASTSAGAAQSKAGVVYNVGDSGGWIVGTDYDHWASTKDFHVGDRLNFAYNNMYHNVVQVNGEDYESCNSNSPIALYPTGSDAINLSKPGDYYFVCGRTSHCQAGQKLHVKVTLPVPNHHSVASPSPTPAPALAPKVTVSSSTPSNNGATSADLSSSIFRYLLIPPVLLQLLLWI